MFGMENTHFIPKRVAAYVRVSNPKSGGRDYQLAEIRKYCALRNWPMPELVYEDAMTARKNPSKDPRPGHARLREDAKRHHFDAIVSWRMDRLARTLDGLVKWRDLAEEARICLAFVADNLTNETNTPMGRLFFGILAVFAEFNGAIIQENREAAQRRHRDNGGDLGGAERKHDWLKIKAYYEAGASWTETAKKFKVSERHLGTILKRLGADRTGRKVIGWKLTEAKREAALAAEMPGVQVAEAQHES